MKMPNGHIAEIDEQKLTDYCLSMDHDHGKHKANLFRELLGIEKTSYERLMKGLRNAAKQGNAVSGKRDQYGQRFHVDFSLESPRGTFRLRSVWIIRTEEVVPDLVTCYIL